MKTKNLDKRIKGVSLILSLCLLIIQLTLGISTANAALVDPSLYYEDAYIAQLKRNGVKKASIVVTSWSESGLQYPRSIHIGSRQARDLPHHLALQQRMKAAGIDLKIYFVGFDNTQHFHRKDRRYVDTTVSKGYRDYIRSHTRNLVGEELYDETYLNPAVMAKGGAIKDDGLPKIYTHRGEALSFEANKRDLDELKGKLAADRASGAHVIGMTAHSAGNKLDQLAAWLGTEMVGTTQAGQVFGTKAGNMVLATLAGMDYVRGTAAKERLVDSLIDRWRATGEPIKKENLNPLLKMGVDEIAEEVYTLAIESMGPGKTPLKRVIIKHNTSSTGKGNHIVDISSVYRLAPKERKAHLIDLFKGELAKLRHKEKDIDLLEGQDPFYSRKIGEIGAIVEPMIEGKECISPATVSVVQENGEVVTEYIYDQILGGDAGQNFGGSRGPTKLNATLVAEMKRETEKLGKAYHSLGGSGYFGVDFLKCDGQPLKFIEANLRKTGTKYPFLFAKQILTSRELGTPDRKGTKVLFHDDNIELGFSASDLPRGQEQLKEMMDHFYGWVRNHPDAFGVSGRSGFIFTFDTHASGKLGALIIADSDEETKRIRKAIDNALKHFYEVHYPQNILSHDRRGVDLIATDDRGARADFYINSRGEKVDLKTGRVVPNERGGLVPPAQVFLKVSKPPGHRGPVKLAKDTATATRAGIHRGRLALSDAAHSATRTARRAVRGKTPPPEPGSIEAARLAARRASGAQGTGLRPAAEVRAQRQNVGGVVFGVFGKSKTSDVLLIETKERDSNAVAMRLDENAQFHFDENTRIGTVSNVWIPVEDKRTGKWRMERTTEELPLPNVVYDYDFSAQRIATYESRGAHGVQYKTEVVKKFLEEKGRAVFINSVKTGRATIGTSPTKSQPAFRGALKRYAENREQVLGRDSEISKFAKRVSESYPETHLLADNLDDKLKSLIDSGGHFYVKPQASSKKSGPFIGNIAVKRFGTVLRLEYFVKEKGTDATVLKKIDIAVAGLTAQAFRGYIDDIKAEMGFAMNDAFYIQRALARPELLDPATGRKMQYKVRIVTQRNPSTGALEVTQKYATIGGADFFTGRGVSLDVLSCRAGITPAALREAEEVAKISHSAVEFDNGNSMGELITDVLISYDSVVPLISKSKPERVPEVLVEQTNLGYFYEGSREARVRAMSEIYGNEDRRIDLILAEKDRLYEEYVRREQEERNKVDKLHRSVGLAQAPVPSAAPAVVREAGPSRFVPAGVAVPSAVGPAVPPAYSVVEPNVVLVREPEGLARPLATDRSGLALPTGPTGMPLPTVRSTMPSVGPGAMHDQGALRGLFPSFVHPVHIAP